VGIALADPQYYPPPKEVAFLADGNEVLRATLEANQGLQRLSLPAPVAMKELTLKVLSARDGGQGYGAVGSLEAYDAAGKNVLLGPPLTVYGDANTFTQKDEHAWDGAYFALHGRPNMIYYQKVLSFDPRTSTITMEMLTADQYPTTGSTIGRFSMINALCVLDRPGEYVVDEKPRADGTQRVYLWPLDGNGPPDRIAYSVRANGFTVSGSYVTVEGFLIRKQGGKANAFGITGGRGSDILVRDNEVTLVRAARNQVIGLGDANRVTIANNYVHECRRAGAIALDRCADSVIRDNRLHKNGATCLLLYRSRNILVERNVLTDHKGMHANGLTAYLNCRGIAFVGNRVQGGNNALTLQEGEDMLVASNLFDAEGFASPVGLWGVGTLKNIRFDNNLFLRTDPNSSWGLGVYCGGEGDMVGYVFKNNVVDGIYREGPIVAVHENNVYTRPCVSGEKDNDWKMGPNEVLEPDLKKLFVDPDKGDWRPRPGGPLDGSGVDVGLAEDIAGAKVPPGKAPNIGAYQTR
jgi:parallel beta-helix repeat protein